MQKTHSRYAKIIVALVRGFAMLALERDKRHIANTPKGQIFKSQSQKVEGCAIEIVLQKCHTIPLRYTKEFLTILSGRQSGQNSS